MKESLFFMSIEDRLSTCKRCKTRRESEPAKKYRLLHRQCYDNTRKLINLLTVALDKGFIDEEGSRMLDLAMIDYSRDVM